MDRDGNPFTHECPACKANKQKEKGADESDYDYSQRSIIEYRYSAHPSLGLWLSRSWVPLLCDQTLFGLAWLGYI